MFRTSITTIYRYRDKLREEKRRRLESHQVRQSICPHCGQSLPTTQDNDTASEPDISKHKPDNPEPESEEN